MRSVLFNKRIPYRKEKLEKNTFETKVPGTGCMETGYPNKGLFHQWGVESEGDEGGYDSYSVAIVELADGTIETVAPCNMKFEFPLK